MTSPVLQWFLRGCLLVAGLLAAAGSWHLASWTMQKPDPVRGDLLAQAAFALSLGFYFSLAAAVVARLKRRDFSARVALTAYAVFGVIAALMLLVAWVRQPFGADAMP